MKIKDINQWFRKFALFQQKYRWYFILLAVLLLAAGVAGMKHVKVTSDSEGWFNDAEAIEIATKKFENQFGNNESIALLIESNDVFHPEVLKMIDGIGQELLDKVPYADEITSLTELEVSVGTDEGIDVINPFENGIPDDPKKLKEIKELILSRKSLVNKIVSSDATETWLVLSLHDYPKAEEWKKKGNTQPLFQDGEAAIAVVTDEKWKSDRYTIKAVGMPYTETEERDFFGNVAKKTVMSSFLVMVILLIVFVRSFRGIVVPIISTIGGIVVVFGIMGWLKIYVDANMMTLPILLGMALSVGYSIHLVNAFKRYFRGSGKRKESAVQAVEETGWPILFTAITTMGSVMSFAAAGIMPVAWLGFTCAAVVMTDYIFVITLIPILMSFGKDKPEGAAIEKRNTVIDHWMEKFGAFVLRYKVAMIITYSLVVIVLLPGITKIRVDMDMFEFMGKKIPYINRVYDVVHSKLGSYMSYNITIEFEEENKVKEPEVLRKFESLLEDVGQFELTKKNEGVPKIFSILDIVKEMNQSLNGDKAEFYKIPDTKELVAQELFLYEMSGGTKAMEWLNEDYSMLRAQVEIQRFNSTLIEDHMQAIEEKGAKLFPDAKVVVIGGAIRFAGIHSKVVSGEIKSFLTALVVIGLLLMLVFSSIKTGLIGMIPNMTPLIAIGGFMGHAGYQLDMMSMTIIPMLLGIAVDDTIHLINQIKFEYEKCGHYKTAILSSFAVVGKTLTMTTVILTATFLMYVFAPIATFTRIGILSSIGLLSALVADFLMTPSLIMMTKPFGKERV